VDGLEFDEDGNVVAYKRLKYHPGSNYMISNFDFDRIESKYIIHWFKRIRPAQHRGLSEVASALRLFGDMRRYTSAVIAAAETAADFAAFLKTNAPAADVAEVDPWQSVEIQKRAMVTLPDQWEVQQLKAEQPTSTYAMFKREILNEVGRSIGLPFNMTALDSSGYNYASGRMDHQLYQGMIRVERDELQHTALDRIFCAWLDEAVPLGLIPRGLGPYSEWEWSWTWDGREHVDPAKEATAAETRLRTHTTTLSHEYAKQGKDWQTELAQRAKEVAAMRELGLIVDLEPAANYTAPGKPEQEGGEE
jgi:capsid protein